MAPQLTHRQIQELLGAYALDAVDADEAAVVDAHLPECPRCRTEVQEHREAATLLSFSGEAAPGAVWSRIATSLEEPAPIVAFPVGARRRPVFSAVAMGIAAALAVILGVQVVHQGRRIDHLTSIAAERGLAQAAAAAAAEPGARRVHLRSDDGRRVADAIVLPMGQGYVVRADLPTLGDDQTYQLWGVLGAQTISLGVLGPHPAVTPFRATGPLKALAISAERAGGAVAPTRAPIVQGFVESA